MVFDARRPALACAPQIVAQEARRTQRRFDSRHAPAPDTVAVEQAPASTMESCNE